MAEVPGTPESGGLSRIPFTVAAENEIKTLSFWLTVVGWLNIAGAVLSLISLAAPGRNLGLIVNAIIYALIGAWALQAAKAFQGVASTDVADQAYLVEGFTKLRSIFLLEGVLILIGLAFIAATLLFLVIVGVRAH
jgi:hypothetical protein